MASGKLGTGLPLRLGAIGSSGTFGLGQAQAKINNFGVNAFAQAQAFVLVPTVCNTTSPSGNVLIMSGGAETVVPGCDLTNLTATGSSVTIQINFWFSVDHVGVLKHTIVRLYRGSISSGTVIASQNFGDINSDPTDGHAQNWSTSVVDNTPGNEYTLTVQEDANPSGSNIWSDTRTFCVVRALETRFSVYGQAQAYILNPFHLNYGQAQSRIITSRECNTTSPTGNVLVVTGTTETVLPGCDVFVIPSLSVSLNWNIWISHNNNGTFKRETLAIKRDNIAGATLASFDTGAADGGDSTGGHQFNWAGTFTDSSPTTGHYVLTTVETASGVGNPANTQTWSDTRTFCALALGTFVLGQAQAYVNASRFGLGQAQAEITDGRMFAQAQAKINAFDVSRFGQAQADIDVTSFVFGQSLAVIQSRRGILQLRSGIWTEQRGPGYPNIGPFQTAAIEVVFDFIADETGLWAFQWDADISGTFSVNGVLLSTSIFGGVQTFTTTFTAGNLYNVVIHYAFSNSNSNNFNVKYHRPTETTFEYLTDNAPPWIPEPLVERTGQAQAKLNSFDFPQFGQAQSSIKDTSFSLAQAQASIRNFYVSAQAQAKINAFDVNGFGQAQADTLSTSRGFGQAQTYVGHFKFGNALADILATSNKFGQSQARIKQTSEVSGQAQARINWHLTDNIVDSYTITDASGVFAQNIDTFTPDTGGIPDPSAIGNNYSGWIQIQIFAPSLLVLDLNGETLTQIAVYSGFIGLLSPEATGTNFISVPVLPATLTATGIYFIEVSASSPLGHNLTINFSLVPLAAYAQSLADIHQVYYPAAQALAIINQAQQAGQAEAYIFEPFSVRQSAQAQADILATQNKFGQSASIIKRTVLNSAQAQTRIIYFGEVFAQAQASIVYKTFVLAQAQVQIFVPILSAQAQADILQIYYEPAQARPHIRRTEQAYGQSAAEIVYKRWSFAQATAFLQRGSPPGTNGGPGTVFGPPEYVVVFDGIQLPGYAQSEQMTTTEQIDDVFSFMWDGSEGQQAGLQNQVISMEYLIYAPSWRDAEDAYSYGTAFLGKQEEFKWLYIDNPDRHYEAFVKHVGYAENVSHNRHTLRYTVDFECKPWIVANDSHTLTGSSGLITTTGRTLNNGTWTPTHVTITGTNVIVSGYTASEFTGYINVSGIVQNMVIDSENMTISINGENGEKRLRWVDYALFVGPGETTFDVTGASSIEITYNDRWL